MRRPLSRAETSGIRKGNEGKGEYLVFTTLARVPKREKKAPLKNQPAKMLF